MICIDDKIVSRDLFTEYFLCNYKKCHGVCCIEGESGAPLAEGEADVIRGLLSAVWPMLADEAKGIISQQGVSYIDTAYEEVTSLVAGRNCVFTTYSEHGSCLCAFEKLYREGKSDFPKPISCHLYPIRLHHYSHGIALNYDRWDICRSACVNGRRKGVPLFRALKDPLIRAFGKDFFAELESCEKLLLEESTMGRREF